MAEECVAGRNACEFAVAKGTPYAIDFMNPVPDVDLHSIGEESFEWVVDAVARLAVTKARAAGRSRSELRWDSLLGQDVGGVTSRKRFSSKNKR